MSRERAKAEVEGRKTLFVHVRLNRVHCRVTYQVLPSLSVKSLKHALKHIPPQHQAP